jgi:hypothetical protein
MRPLLPCILVVCLLTAASEKPSVTISVEGERRIIQANGLPDHQPGQFPNRNNPNRISAQSYRFSVPAHPVANEVPAPFRMQAFGIAINGIPFDPFAAEWYDEAQQWQYEPHGGGVDLGLDKNHAHVQPTGAYHYHGLPTDLILRLTGGKPQLVHLGWAADGFPIYGPWGYEQAADRTSPVRKLTTSYQLKKGQRPSGGPPGKYDGTFVADYEYVAGSGDLDECNGRFGPTPEFPEGTYHYYITDAFPFIPRAYKGTPDPSFERRGPPPGGPGGPPGMGKGKGKGKGKGRPKGPPPEDR